MHLQPLTGSILPIYQMFTGAFLVTTMNIALPNPWLKTL